MEEHRLLTINETMQLLGMKRSTFYLVKKRPDFPKPIKIGRMTRFKLSDILEWIEKKKKESEKCEE